MGICGVVVDRGSRFCISLEGDCITASYIRPIFSGEVLTGLKEGLWVVVYSFSTCIPLSPLFQPILGTLIVSKDPVLKGYPMERYALVMWVEIFQVFESESSKNIDVVPRRGKNRR